MSNNEDFPSNETWPDYFIPVLNDYAVGRLDDPRLRKNFMYGLSRRIDAIQPDGWVEEHVRALFKALDAKPANWKITLYECEMIFRKIVREDTEAKTEECVLCENRGIVPLVKFDGKNYTREAFGSHYPKANPRHFEKYWRCPNCEAGEAHRKMIRDEYPPADLEEAYGPYHLEPEPGEGMADFFKRWSKEFPDHAIEKAVTKAVRGLK
ncbi:MAG TPA: hypothetical protein VM223_23605 [Planctomycetota bacterium]|nr:hypothetical protein [Planctomycetota bacterium]